MTSASQSPIKPRNPGKPSNPANAERRLDPQRSQHSLRLLDVKKVLRAVATEDCYPSLTSSLTLAAPCISRSGTRESTMRHQGPASLCYYCMEDLGRLKILLHRRQNSRSISR